MCRVHAIVSTIDLLMILGEIWEERFQQLYPQSSRC